MENLEIITRSITVQARKIINGNTVTLAWNHSEGSAPQAINFNVQRGTSGEVNFMGNNAISGAFYPENGKFDVQNNNVQEGDLVMYADLLATCREIATPQEE